MSEIRSQIPTNVKCYNINDDLFNLIKKNIFQELTYLSELTSKNNFVLSDVFMTCHSDSLIPKQIKDKLIQEIFYIQNNEPIDYHSHSNN
jgi:hypothetical protein